MVDATAAAPADDAYRLVARGINSSENPYLDANAKNPRSSATGNGQFLDGTWLPLLKSARPDLANGKTDAQILEMRGLPQLSEDMTTEYARQNGASLGSSGVPVTPTSLYMAHILGPGGATAALKASANTPMSSIVSPGVLAANPAWAGMNNGQFQAHFGGKVTGGISAASAEDAQWARMGAKQQPDAPLSAEEEAQWGRIGANPQPIDTARPSSDFRYVTPYTAPDGATTSIAPEDYDRFNALIKYDQAHPAPAPKPGSIDPITNQVVQSVGPADTKSPVAQSLGKPIEEGRLPGPISQAAVSLPTDPDAQRRVMAAQAFPGLSPVAAQSHLFTAPDGRMAAVDDAGNPYYVQPRPPSLSDSSTLSPGNLLAYSASGIGSQLPIAGGILGGLAGTPGSPAGSVALAGAGAALGDQFRQYGARMVDPQPELAQSNPLQTAKEAAFAAAGQGVGSIINHAISPNALHVAVPDLRAIRTPGAMDAARDAYTVAGRQGVDLTPGQATGLGSLLGYEDAARSMPGTRDVADAFYRRQGLQLQGAGNALLDGISPNANKTEAAQLFQQGADDAITGARQQANAAARPSYDAAQARGNVMSPDLAQIAEQPAVQTAMDRARVTYQNLYRTPAPETPDFRLWDLTKRSMDDMHGAAVRNADGLAGRTTASGIDSLRSDLLTHLDAAYPEYAAARETAGTGQRLASRLEDSGTGTTAVGTGAERAKAITGPIFGQNPQAIAESRDAFAAAGRTDEWNAGVRAHLQDAFEKASMSQQGLNPSMLRRQVWGNTDNRDAMRAAMTPSQFTGFDNFMRTIENVAQTYPMNSLTASRGEALNALKGAASDSGDIRAVRSVANLFSIPKLLDLPSRAGDAYAHMRTAQNMRGIIGNLFSPDGLQYLEAMSRYAPGSQRAIAVTSQFAARFGPRLSGVSSGGEGQSSQPQTNPLLGGSAPQR